MRFPFVVTRCMVVSFSTRPGPHAGPSGEPVRGFPRTAWVPDWRAEPLSLVRRPAAKPNGDFWTGQEKTEKMPLRGLAAC
jgi:hypothetical protein